MNKDLFLIRGLPSSGKTTFAWKIANHIVSADDYFEKDGQYNFDASKLHEAHKQCKAKVEKYLSISASPVVVANTFTTDKEMKPYFELADKYGYTVTTVIMESRHGNKNNHIVPEETVKKMKARFNIVL